MAALHYDFTILESFSPQNSHFNRTGGLRKDIYISPNLYIFSFLVRCIYLNRVPFSKKAQFRG